MEFNARKLREEDYDNTLKGWWTDWGGEIPPRSSLAENGVGGVMVSKGDTDICAGYLYQTNSDIAFCEFVVSNYNYREKDRGQAIEFLIETISQLAKIMGARVMWATVFNKSLVQKYKNTGYIQTQDRCIELVKHL
jgi:hypothetical protein